MGHRTGCIILPGLVFDSPFSRIEPTPVTVMPNQYAQAAPICNRPEGPGVQVEARSSATCSPMRTGSYECPQRHSPRCPVPGAGWRCATAQGRGVFAPRHRETNERRFVLHVCRNAAEMYNALNIKRYFLFRPEWGCGGLSFVGILYKKRVFPLRTPSRATGKDSAWSTYYMSKNNDLYFPCAGVGSDAPRRARRLLFVIVVMGKFRRRPT